MNTLPKKLALMLTLVALFYLAGPCTAAEKATKEECIAKVEQAAKLINKIGIEPAIEKLMDKAGPYRWKDSYVFCMNVDRGKLMAHPMARFIGMPMKTWKDADGKQPFANVIDEIDTKGKGWVSYSIRPRGAEKAAMKHTYFMKVPGVAAILGAGYME